MVDWNVLSKYRLKEVVLHIVMNVADVLQGTRPLKMILLSSSNISIVSLIISPTIHVRTIDTGNT